MEWEQIAEVLAELVQGFLNDLNQDIIDFANSNPGEEFEIPQDMLDQIREAAEQADIDLSQAAFDDFPEDVDEDTEFTRTSPDTIEFFLTKNLIEGAAAIIGATVAVQILQTDRAEAQSSALERALARITNAARSESSSSFALKHQELAIESDFNYYRYNTSEDDVVRTDHVSRNQRVFRYGAERVADDVPGLANNCRCFAEPLTLEEALAGTFFYSDDRPDDTQASAMKHKFKIKSEGNTVTVDIVGDIEAYDGNDFLTFFTNLSQAIDNDRQQIVINITSWGGSGNDGMAAYAYLTDLPNPVQTNVFGFAGSAATYFLMAADVGTIGENDNFFIHQAWTCIPCGNKAELAENSSGAIDALTEFDERQVEIYMAKTGLSEERVEELLNAERVISADEALELGFVDEIRPDSNRSREARGEISAKANYSALLKAHKPTSIEGQTMNFEELLAAIEAASDEIKAQLYAKLALVSKADSDEAKTAAVAEVQAKLDEANTQIDAKDSVIQAAATAAAKEADEDDREKIRAEVRAELEAEDKAKATISAQVLKAGLKVEGETSTDILANAIEQSGGASKDKDDKQFDKVVLDQIWASVLLVRGQDHNADEISALGKGTETTEGKTTVVKGSRADRINSK